MKEPNFSSFGFTTTQAVTWLRRRIVWALLVLAGACFAIGRLS